MCWIAGVAVLVVAALCARRLPTSEGWSDEHEATSMSRSGDRGAVVSVTAAGGPSDLEEVAELLETDRAPDRGTVEGLVRDKQGVPAEAEVVFRTEDDPLGRSVTTRSSADGTFSIDLESGKWTVHAESEGRTSPTRDVYVFRDESKELELTLEEAAVVSGIVTDPYREPVEGARIVSFASWRPGASSTSDDLGRYRLQVHADTGASLLVIAEGYPALTSRLELVAAMDLRRDFRLQKGVRVVGRVLDRSGMPIPEAGIQALVSGTGAPADLLKRSTLTDGQGQFVLEDLSVAFWVVHAQAKGYLMERERVDMRRPRDLEFRLWRTGLVEGRIVPFPGMDARTRVRAEFGCQLVRRGDARQREWDPGGGYFRGSGEFVVQNVPPGRFAVQVHLPGFARSESPEFDVAEGATVRGIEVHLVPGATIRGTVRSGATGSPLPAARIRVSTVHTDGRRIESNAKADDSGHYEVVGLGTGEVELRFDAEGHAGQSRKVGVTAGREYVEDFVLDRGLSVKGRVLVDGLAPPGTVRVGLFRSDGFRADSIQVGPEGSIEVGGIEQGEWILGASMRGGEGRIQTLSRRVRIDGSSSPLNIELRTLPRVHGRASQDGLPLYRKQIHFYIDPMGDGTVFTTYTDEEGRFEVGGISPGDWSLSTRDPLRSVKAFAAQPTGATDEGGIRITIPFGASETTLDLDFPAGR